MRGRGRLYIAEGDHPIILVDHFRRYFTRDDAAENAFSPYITVSAWTFWRSICTQSILLKN